MPGSVIVAGARTPIGKLAGALAGLSAMDLGGFAIKAALERSGGERRRGGGVGAAALCGGGRQGDALVVRSVH